MKTTNTRKKNHKTRAGKIPKQLRTLAALAENPSSGPILGSSSKRSKVLIQPTQVLSHTVHIWTLGHKQIQIKLNKP